MKPFIWILLGNAHMIITWSENKSHSKTKTSFEFTLVKHLWS